MAKFLLGIDLGDANLKITYCQDGDSSHNAALKPIPSYVSFYPKNREFYTKEDLLTPFPSFLKDCVHGTPIRHFLTSNRGTITAARNQEPGITSIQLVAMLLSNGRKAFEARTGHSPQFIVLTCPHWLSSADRQSLVDSSIIAGLTPIGVLSDIVASCIDYNFSIAPYEGGERKLFAIIDIGQSTSTVAIASSTNGGIQVLSIVTDPHFGGRLADQAIMDSISKRMESELRHNLKDSKLHDPTLFYHLCSYIKERLATVDEVQVDLKPLLGFGDQLFIFSRAELISILKEWHESACQLLINALAISELEIEQLSSIELIGGCRSTVGLEDQFKKTIHKSCTLNTESEISPSRGATIACSLLHYRPEVQNGAVFREPQSLPFIFSCNPSTELKHFEDDCTVIWEPLPVDDRMADITLAKLVQEELSMEEANKLVLVTEDLHEALVNNLINTFENIEDVYQVISTPEEVIKLRNTATSILDWLISTKSLEMTPLAYKERLKTIKYHVAQLEKRHGASSSPSRRPTRGTRRRGGPPRRDGRPAVDERFRELFNTGLLRQSSFEKHKNVADLQESISLFTKAMERISDSDPHMKGCLVCLAASLHFWSLEGGKEEDMERSTALLERAYTLFPESGDVEMYRNLAAGLLERYQSLGNVADIEKAIRVLDEAISFCPILDDPDAVGCLSNLSVALCQRFQTDGSREYIERAMIVSEQALDIDIGHQYLAERLNNIANVLSARFDVLGEKEDVDRAVSYAQQLYDLPTSSVGSSNFHTLGIILLSRSRCFSGLEDIQGAIEAFERAIQIAGNQAQRASHLNGLASALVHSYERTSQISELERAVDTCNEGIRIASDSDHAKPGLLATLGMAIVRLFESGNRSDLDDAVEVSEKAARLAKGRRLQPLCYTNLGQTLSARFLHFGNIHDIDKAVRIHEKSIDNLPSCHSERLGCLNDLLAALGQRYCHFLQPKDIERAIKIGEELLELTPPTNSRRPIFLASQASNFGIRLKVSKNKVDAESAISLLREAAKNIGSHDPAAPRLMHNLGRALLESYRLFPDDPSLLDEAITCLKNAVHMLPDDVHPMKHRCLESVGAALSNKFEVTREKSHIDEAIKTLEEAVRLVPESHPGRATYLLSLGIAFQCRGIQSVEPMDLFNAVREFGLAAESDFAAPWTRVEAAQGWIQVTKLLGHPDVLKAYDCLLDLFPRVVWVGFSMEDRRREIEKLGSLARDGVGTAIAKGDYKRAITWLEKGRFIIWSQSLQLRSPIDELKKVYPLLAKRLEEVSNDLEGTGQRHNQILGGKGASPREDHITTEACAQRQRNLAGEWTRTVEAIRKKKGFEDFLRSKPYEALMQAAEKQPVAIVNDSEDRCDILLLENPHNVRHIPLSIKHEELRETVQQLRGLLRSSGRSQRALRSTRGMHYEEEVDDWVYTLGYLWTEVVLPLINTMKLNSSSNPIRLCWCPTGYFSQLPLHAAGNYEEGAKGLSVLDFLISSYTPSLGLLCREPIGTRNAPQTPPMVLVVGVSQTKIKGMVVNPLPMVKQEIDVIRNIVPKSSIIVLQDEAATSPGVLQRIPDCDILHMACHAYQNLRDPLGSAFLLHKEKLELGSLINQSISRGQLAFLSACQTAKGDEKTPDEAMHLAGGILFAGFRTVVATMWSIDDNDGPRMAEGVYSAIFRNGKVATSDVSLAVHTLMKNMRDGRISFERWVPFICLGI